jgi:4-hydroxybenzoate polyprenyltransferase
MLNPLCFALAPLVILIVCGYSYTKRFTSLSHLVLGLSLGLAPIGAWIAVTGRVGLLSLVLGAAVVFWVAGFDILYAFMDIDHGLAKQDTAFFNLNGLLSLRMFVATLGDVLFAK